MSTPSAAADPELNNMAPPSDIFTKIWSYLTSKYFIVYCLMNYAWVLWAYNRTMTKFTHKSKQDVARDEKYSAFKRNDIEKIKRIWPQALILSPMIMLKGLLAYLPWALMLIFSWIAVKLDRTKQKRVYDQWSYKVMRGIQIALARWDFFWYGAWPGCVHTEYVQVDYRKYLGPDWRDDKERIPTTVIANHSSINDIVVSMYMGMPC